TPGAVELVKVDSEDATLYLENAVFELQDRDGETIQSDLTTDESGSIIVNNLDVGKYQFVEQVPPYGYDLDSKPIQFEIVRGQSEVLKIVQTNTLTTGEAVVTKVDASNQELKLEGAEFKVVFESGET
ncbi:collagen binding domain-containing protein, partial [Anaerobacillus sp. 1_MG-2023]|uniref:MSCRAMM family protein n=1 Tax=Anaerobacillus sp. 1_MG-2023 TaxID=3062655 RepID=UPI0026E46B59